MLFASNPVIHNVIEQVIPEEAPGDETETEFDSSAFNFSLCATKSDIHLNLSMNGPTFRWGP